MTKRTKVERWVALNANGVGIATEATREAAERWTKDAYGSKRWGHKVVRLAPADPLARLKEDVLRAARAVVKHPGDDQVDNLEAALAAVERLERKR